MSSGHILTGSFAYTDKGFAYERQWGGDDGKYESVAGYRRLKWNNYELKTRSKSAYLTDPGKRTYGSLAGDPVVLKSFVGWTANDELRTLNKLAEKIRGHQFDLGINIAEARKSYQTIISNVYSLGRALLYLKHGKFAAAARELGVPSKHPRSLRTKDLSGRWLEMQYGWMPLVSASFDAAKALEAITGPRVLRFKASSGLRKSVNDRSQAPGVYEYLQNSSVSISYIAELYEDLSLERQLKLVDPAGILWEVTPWSFVIDWFIPVGSYLSAWAIIPKLKGRFLTITRCSATAGPMTWLGVGPMYVDCGKKEKYFYYQRVYSTQLEVPRPSFNRLPRALSPRRIFNAIALIHQRLR